MTTICTTPNSPPELSGSKSSKSSSFRSSSQLSGPDGILADISNFEEIGLEDDPEMPYMDGVTAVYGKSGVMVRSTTARLQPKTPTTTTRDLTSNVKPTRTPHPSLKGHANGALTKPKHSSTKIGSGNQRSVSSTHTLPIQSSAPHRSRSNSPLRMASNLGSSPSAQTLAVSPVHGRPPLNRKSSWQRSRKSLKELEEEYHDSDEELPDDTSLWNVPISPRPLQDRASSRGTSPDGRSPGPRPLPLSHSVSDMSVLSSTGAKSPRGSRRADRWCAQAPLVLSVDRFHLAIPAFTHTTQCCRIFRRRRRSSLKLWNIMPTNAIANVQRTSRAGSPRYDPAPNRNATPKPQLNCLLCKSAIS